VSKLLTARLPEDADEERKVHKLAGSRHAPGDWIFRARIVSLSWQGLPTARIAEELGCHPKTVRKRLHRFNAYLQTDGDGGYQPEEEQLSRRQNSCGFVVPDQPVRDVAIRSHTNEQYHRRCQTPNQPVRSVSGGT
jgi:hypothetical protein